MQRLSRLPDIRSFVVDHGEKGAACLAGVLILAALAATNWVPYGRPPETLLAQLADARAKLETEPWPAAEQSRFALTESRRPDAIVVSTLLAPVPLSHYLPSQPQLKRPGAGDRTLRLPDLEPVQQLIASHERVLLRLAPAVESTPAAPHDWEGSVGLAADRTNQSDEFRSRRGVVTTIPAPALPVESESLLRPAALRGRGYPYTAVRGVFDLRSTARAFQAATHRSNADALRQIVVRDFQLERQELVRQPDRWSDWEPVDVQVFRDVAAAADGFEPDVVSAQVTDSAITAPLLSRITGRWRILATHPRLTTFELSPGALERETAFLKALVAQADQQRKASAAATAEKGGFAPLIRDARQLQQQLLAGNSAGAAVSIRRPFGPPLGGLGGLQGPQPANPALEQLIRDVARELDPRAQDRQLREWVRARATADGELLLFRYFDFDVEPGTVYRYRVRLELLNPNYGRSLSAAAGEADVVRTRTLWTPWSEPTPPVPVAENTRYFLTGIDARRRGRTPLARMKVFQYDQELGTTVRDEIDVPFGQNIAGRAANAEQFDPAQATIRFAEYFFRSDDILVDALPDLAFLSDLHPDLALPPHSRGAAQLVESALVVNDRRDLIALDRVSQAAELAAAQHLLEQQTKLAEEMVRQPDPLDDSPGSTYDDLYGRLYGKPPSSGDAAQRRTGPNVLQRGRSR